MDDLEIAIEQFNRGEYFEQHETLERMWRAEPWPARELYQGILQIGVGFYHLQRGNYAGALHLLERGLQRLAPLAPVCRDIDVARLISETERCRSAVIALAAGQAGAFNWSAAPQIHPVGGDSVRHH